MSQEVKLKRKEESQSVDRMEIDKVRQEIAVEAAAIGTFEWDIPTSAFSSSERFMQILGLDPTTSFTHDSITALIHPEDEAIRLKANEVAAKTGKLFYETRFIRPDKTIRWIRVNGKVIFDLQGQAVKMFGVAVDITEEKTLSDRLEHLVPFAWPPPEDSTRRARGLARKKRRDDVLGQHHHHCLA